MIFFVDIPSIRLDLFIKQKTNFSIRAIRRMCKEGFVFVNKKNSFLPSLLKKGDIIEIRHTIQTIPSISIMDEHVDFIALFKPSSLHTASLSGKNNHSVEAFCNQHFPQCFLCNRLDFYTSGIILLAKTKKIYHLFKNFEKNSTVEKVYYAIVNGIAQSTLITQAIDTNKKRKSIVLHSQEKDSSRYTKSTVLASDIKDTNNNICSLVELRIHRGARHQIRAHLAFTGTPLYNDILYSSSEKNTLPEQAQELFFLHNHTLAFESILFTAPIPKLWTEHWGKQLLSYIER